jgi:lysophospholipase L1-like esterase
MILPRCSGHVAAIATLFAMAVACGTTVDAPVSPAPDDAGALAPPPDGTSPASSTPPALTIPPAVDAGPVGSDPDVDPGAPAVQLVGRFDRSDPRGPVCGFPGCRVVARFRGTGDVTVALEGSYETWMEGAPSEWDVAVDGAVTQTYALTLGAHAIEIGGLDPGTHVVELYKRSEAQTGLGRFLGLDLHGGELLPPPPRPTRRIEIIGDSQPAAFGVESFGLGPSCPGVNWSGHYENFRKSFGAVLGTMFGAEVFGTVYSGKGVAQNIWSTDDETMPLIYRRANPLDAKSTWDVTSWKPDAIVVMLGGNDFAIGQPFDRGPTTLGAFAAAYRAFAAELRRDYPAALLVLTVSPSVSDPEPAGRASRTNVTAGVHAVVTERVAAGDDRVLELAPTIATAAELVGCNGHGTPAFHTRVASEIAPVIAAKLGW